jgi:DNA polymerase I-like protein with 3'-5' exonuclease and polymerase domains
MVADIADVDRTTAKVINLGIMYGMGIGKLANVMGGIEFSEAKAIRNDYDERVPFIKEMASSVMKAASERQEIKTLAGRKCRFPMRELKGYNKGSSSLIHKDRLEERWEDVLATPLDERDQGWKKLDPSRYQVAFTYKSLNRLIQASSADQTKMAMKLCFDHGYLPMLTVHDELCFSIKSEEDVPIIKELMENCVPDLSIPSVIDVGIGTDWGNAK